MGASFGSTLDPAFFSNTGSRLDLHAWGASVTTTGGGGLQGPPAPESEWYTTGFNGTSAAAAIVAGAVASLQGAVETAFGFPLDGHLTRSVLGATGTPQNAGPNIGPRPDLLAAWTQVSAGVGAVAGNVTESGTGDPIEGADVVVVETGAFTRTGSAGEFTLPLVAGNYTLRIDSFFHQTQYVPVTVTHDATTSADAVMNPKPTTQLVAKARHATTYQDLEGVRVTPLGVPIPPGVTGADGTVLLGPVPGGTYRLLYDGVPGLGAGFRELTFVWEGSPPASVEMLAWLHSAYEDFEGGNAGYVSTQGIWTYGTPQAGGPTGGFSGTKCWGVGMTGNYPDAASDTLFTVPYDFSSESPPFLFLSLHYWSEMESDYDGVAMDVGNFGAHGLIFGPREPLGDYSHEFLAGLATPGLGDYAASGWSGSTGGWRGAVFDLTDRIPYDIFLRFRFGSDSGINGEGFWIDDLTFDTGVDTSALDSPVPSSERTALALAAFPNPTSSEATLAWRAPRHGPASLHVFDVQGRRVRTLVDGADLPESGTVRWDGRDEGGQRLAAGVYWVRLTQENETTVRKIVLLR